MYGNHTYVIMLQGPYIRIPALVKVYEFTCQPIIFFPGRVIPLDKILLIFGIGLPADLHPLDEPIRHGREINVENQMFIHRIP